MSGRGGRGGGKGGNNAPKGGPAGGGAGGGKGGNNKQGGGGGAPSGKGGNNKQGAQPTPKQANKPATKEVEVVTPGAAAAQGKVFSFEAPKDQSGFQFNFPAGSEAFDVEKLKSLQTANTVDSLPAPVQNRVSALKKLNKQREALKKKFEDELRELEIKYEALYAPLYSRRAVIVDGTEEPTQEEVGEDAKPTETKEPKGIPDFWLGALKGYPVIEDLITPRDEPALKFLKDIRLIRLDNEDFGLEFHFTENPYFENSVITKTYRFKHMEEEDEWEFDKSECSELKWKPEKNLTVTLQKKKQKKRGSRPAKVKVEEQPCESFFNFFTTPQFPDDVSALDEEELDELEQIVEQDYEMGMFMKERMIPQAVLFFTGEAGSFDDDYGFDDDDDDDDAGELDSDEEIEDDDDDDDHGVASAQPGQQPAECKQQ